MRVTRLLLSCSLCAVAAFVACSPSSGGGSSDLGPGGGSFGAGGSSSPDAGTSSSGGASASGGAGTGATPGAGGASSGGNASSGGAPSGGTPSDGGAPGAGGAPLSNPCGPVFKDCNGDTSDGCETNLDTDPGNCGACSTPCPGATNATPVCFVGQCDYACKQGFGDCNASADDGCEVDLLSDAKNCGACRMDCGDKKCQNGGCECASTSTTAERSPLDIYVLFDQSGSMNQGVTGGTKWNVIKGALTTFVQSSGADGISIGIGYFPYVNPSAPALCMTDADCQVAAGDFGPCVGGVPIFGCNFFGAAACNCQKADACQANTYSPDVPIAILPGVSSAIVTSLGNHGPGGGTPTYPALQGAYQYATTWATAHPNEKTIVVLATDGDPSGCDGNNNVNTIATNLVAPALAGRPSIMTFVVGVGSSLASLNQIAAAGGTQQAFIVDTAGSDPGGEFLRAMQNITTSALLGCQYGIPNPPSGAPDFTKVNVQITPSSGTPTILPGVPNQAACAGAGGWFYDNPSAPTQIILCDASCQSVSSAGSNVQVLLGCGTNG
ncbi:MAG TPA: vWA domain-containing protein [Polyangiaceae bacterium]|nr:vWA domain-containing protein [Polyangiaceae bacterium]